MDVICGNLIDLALRGQFDVIVHGCNCMNTMGAGIAREIAARLPEAYAADRRTRAGDIEKLGTFSSADILRSDASFTVVNAYTQLDWRGSGVKVRYDAVERVMRAIAQRFDGKRIGYPKIGAGYGGGDWSRIASIIDAELRGQSHALVLKPA